jgi:STE24 endopeptidase
VALVLAGGRGFPGVRRFIAPTWIFPLFNKFEPLDEGELRESS